MQLEARALNYLEANPARNGPTWITFLGLLNRARHELAVAKLPATVEAIRERLEAEEKVVDFTNYQAVVDVIAETFGTACVSICVSIRQCACWLATSGADTGYVKTP